MTFADLIDKQIVVNVRSKEEAAQFVAFSMENYFGKNRWNRDNTYCSIHECETCYEIKSNGSMFLADREYYLEHGYKIVMIDDIDDLSGTEVQPSSDNINDLLM